MKKFIFLLSITAVFNCMNLYAQQKKQIQKATLIVSSEQMIEVPSIASQIADGTFKPAEDIAKEFNPKKWGKNTSVPGKGLPKGNDPLWEKQITSTKTPGKSPTLIFEAASATATPTDPTGAVGPNHFVNAWNSAFRIWDKTGNPLTAPAALGTILNGNQGDPIVMYDRYADRFIITEFYSNGFGMAVCQGPDPVNDGWYQYLFDTDVFPDYPKFSIWSDGYYITANKNSGSAGITEVVYVTDRDKMLVGNATAQMVGFPLTDIVTSGFYSPLGFNCNGPNLPPVGNAPIVYMQDDVWTGVSIDHLKIWSINVDWITPTNSTISSPQIINTVPFDGLFDNGSFSNLPQPSGGDIDALQATIMYMAQYRRFDGYNSAVFNFVVDLDGGDDYAGIRWYELRQNSDGDPWTIYQEGTYVPSSGHSAFSGNMCMDANGNIALAYTSVSTTLYPALRYTGRLASDPLGTMPMMEEEILDGTQIDPSTRYGDYAQMTIDPTDDATFWSIGEVFNSGTLRKSYVGVFQFAPPALTAEFSGSPTNTCVNGPVNFTDQSLGSPNSWTWSFPGGSPNSYIGQNPPAITYSTPGSYNVSLTVGDGVSTDNETKTSYITVSNVIADFTGTPTSIYAGNTVTYTDNSSCTPNSWDWSFPGGTPSSATGIGPHTITYNTAGNYDVTLTVENGLGTDIKTEANYISVLNCAYCATSFSNTSDDYISNVTFNTINNSSGSTNYSDFTGISTEVIPGDMYNISVDITVNGNWVQHCWVWFDWNGDCDLTDTGEAFDLGQTPGTTGTYTLSSNITIPSNAGSGFTRMRISELYSSDPTPCSVATWGEAEDYSINVIRDINLDLRAFLEGPFNGTNMDANIIPYLPLSQPFNTAPWNYTGTENVVSIPNPNVVDWVLIDVRDAATAASANSATSIANQAAFILRDGSIVDLDGSSNLQFDVSISQDMFVVVMQRNHLGIISNDPITSLAGVFTYDFTTGINQVFGGIDGHKEISIGIWGMIGGDANHDGVINVNDKSPLWEAQAGEKGYIISDYNMDGETNNQDKDDVWVPNENRSSQVPN